MLNSSEMRIGKIIKVLSSLNLKRIYDCVISAIRAKKIKKNKTENEKSFFVRGEPLEKNKKVAVYSCVTGDYDKVRNPILVDDDLDYFCISDTPCAADSVWRFLEIPTAAKEYKGGMVNRFCKLNPWHLFCNYDFSIYIDGNIEIVSDIRSLCSIAKNSKIGIAMHLHSDRDCVYNESSICKLYKRGCIPAINKQMDDYRKVFFPEHFGMVEATIIIVDLKNPIAKKIMGDWWIELLRSGSGRDQLSFPYVLWMNGYQISDVGCLGNNRRKNLIFRTRPHMSKFNKNDNA
jgi:hypothetical protein